MLLVVFSGFLLGTGDMGQIADDIFFGCRGNFPAIEKAGINCCSACYYKDLCPACKFRLSVMVSRTALRRSRPERFRLYVFLLSTLLVTGEKAHDWRLWASSSRRALFPSFSLGTKRVIGSLPFFSQAFSGVDRLIPPAQQYLEHMDDRGRGPGIAMLHVARGTSAGERCPCFV